MSFSRETVRGSLQKAFYDLLKYGVGAAYLAFGPPPLSRLAQEYFGMTPGAAMAWAVLLLVVVAFVALFIYVWRSSVKREIIAVPIWDSRPPSKRRTRKKYRNMEVEIDGNEYEFCRFDNVTLKFQGKQSSAFKECQFGGEIHLVSYHPAVRAFVRLTEALKHINPGNFTVGEMDKDGYRYEFDPPIIKKPPLS